MSGHESNPGVSEASAAMFELLGQAIERAGPQLVQIRAALPNSLAREVSLSAKGDVTEGELKGLTFRLLLILDPKS
jgi:hypothetical protein